MSDLQPGGTAANPRQPSWMDQLSRTAASVTAQQLTRMPSAPPDATHAAVLLAFAGATQLIDDAAVLLVRRDSGLRAHAGHVAFPGGRIDPDDDGPVAAALREAHEETTLAASDVAVTATLPELYIPASGYNVTPVLSWLPKQVAVQPNSPGEIETVHWINVGHLLDPQHRVMAMHPSGHAGPAFLADGLFIWGFTAGLLSRLLHAAGFTKPWDTSKVVDIPADFAAGGRQ